MALTTITKKVLKYSEIPEELTKDCWVSDNPFDEFVEVHIGEEDGDIDDAVSEWICENYPELKEEVSFFIHIDK